MKNKYIDWVGCAVSALVILMVSTSSCFAQRNVSNDIQNINLAVFESENLQMELSYQLFFDDMVQSQMQGTVKKNGSMLLQQIGSITIIKKEPYSLFIDTEKKLMILDPFDPKETTLGKNDVLQINVDSLKHHIMSTDVRDLGSKREYIFTLKKGQFSRIILEFNTNNFFLDRLEFHQREDYKDELGTIHRVKMLIEFNKINNRVKIQESAFDMSSYVSIDQKKKKAFAKGNYKAYKFNSNIDKSVQFK